LFSFIFQDIDYGDISDRQRLRKELHCRNFSWLLSTHADHKFVYHKDVFGYGSLCNPSQPHYCLLRDPNVPEYRKLLTALLHIPGPISSSRWANMFALTRTGLLRKDWICVRLRRIHPYWVFSNHMVDLFECPNDYEEPEERQWWLEWQKDQSRRIKAAQLVSPLSGAQAVRTTAHRNAHFRWAYDERNGKLINAETGECLDSIAGFAPLPKPCIDGLPSQEWRFSHTVTGSGNTIVSILHVALATAPRKLLLSSCNCPQGHQISAAKEDSESIFRAETKLANISPLTLLKMLIFVS
uniref:Ricin B-type lectin domain-containing protein n=1 Tax=Schistocephalus solidus TaxID=70667 RepID=A0A183TH86_SCHSO